MIRALALAFALLLSAPAFAGLTRAALDDVGFHVVPGTPLPAEIVLHEGGTDRPLGAYLGGRPTLLVIVDYGCTTLCGVVLDGLGTALDALDLRLGTDYGVLVVPLDPRSTPADAMAFRDRHTAGTRLHDAAAFVTGDAAALGRLRDAVGLVAPFDAEHAQFAHPAGLVLVDADGRAQRALSAFAVDPLDLKLAVTEGSAAPSLGGHALLLCYGWDAATGIYTLQIRRLLSLACALCIIVIAVPVAWHLRRERRSGRARAA